MCKCADENPDLTYLLIKELLIGLDELEQRRKTEYTFGQARMKYLSQGHLISKRSVKH